MTIDITRDDLHRLLAAVDSHVYWELSDRHYRNDAVVVDPGSDDPEDPSEIAACQKLPHTWGVPRIVSCGPRYQWGMAVAAASADDKAAVA